MTNLTTETKTLPGTVVDGIPHLAYFDRASGLSFVWTGNPTEPIHVQSGGYGEPTVALVDVEDSYPGPFETTASCFDWFRQVCDMWNHAWSGVEEHHLAGGDLTCISPLPHAPGHGCIYASSTGSWLEPND